ncbi:PilT protein-like protein [Moorella thermoacetica Y72]|uniref:PilT protein-like protein n=1 Tax=Moorella thermoacetica Y72 TaxID=1325331 RepID=A0A0S6UD52_NEOTH|nr:hypothetical protein [Moorella thermoacetica]GAF25280.1 PilT protein-like protein [Moorella thermoacetica Y72]
MSSDYPESAGDYILDAYAVICYLEDETGADKVANYYKKLGEK